MSKNLLSLQTKLLSLPAYFDALTQTIQNDFTIKKSNPFSNISLRNVKKKFNNNFIVLTVIIVVLVLSLYAISQRLEGSPSTVLSTDDRQAPPKILASKTINKTLFFPIKDSKGETISNLQYKVTSIDLQDEIIVQGIRKRSVRGRLFLVINLKITNDHKQGIELNTKDYVRLTTAGSPEKLAPEIYNDPVQIQAISTKNTRVGFTINDSDKKLALYAGEIDGPKEKIDLTF